MTHNEESRYERYLRDNGLEDIRALIHDIDNKKISLGDLVDVDINNAKPGDVLVITPEGSIVPGKVAENGQPIPLDNYYTKNEANEKLETKADMEVVSSLTAEVEKKVDVAIVETKIEEKSQSLVTKTDMSKGWTRISTLENKVNALEDTSKIDAFTKDESRAIFGTKEAIDQLNSRMRSVEAIPSVDAYTKDQANYLFVNQTDFSILNQRVSNKVDEDAFATLEGRVGSLETAPNIDAYSKEEANGLFASQESLNTINQSIADKVSKSDFGLLTQAVGALESSQEDFYLKSDAMELSGRISALEAKPTVDMTQYYTKTQSDTNYTAKSITTALTNRVTSLEGREVFDPALYYTKTNVDNAFALKIDVTNLGSRVVGVENRAVFDPTLFYTKTNADGLFALKTDLSTLTSRVSSVESRPTFDSTAYYTRTQLDSALLAKPNIELYPMSEYGIAASSMHINNATSAVSLTNGKLWLTRIFVPANTSISKVFFCVKSIGSLPGTAASGVAVFSDAGLSLGTSLLNSLFTSVGWKTATLASPISAQSTGRFVYVGIVCNFGTIPTLYGTTDGPWNTLPSTHRRNISITATTIFPNSFTPASYGNNEIIMPFVGLGV